MRALLFLLFPALELYLLVKVGGETGALNMVLWVFASALIGLWAVRAQGQETMNRTRAEIAAGRVPQSSFLDGLLLFFGGVLLILPGLITDAVGLFLLVPPLRRWAALALARYLTVQQSRPGGASRVIFFRSTNMPGGMPGGMPGPFPGAPRQPYEQQPPYGQAEQDSTEPRQATVIESTAIEINSTESGPGRNNDRQPGAKD